MTESEKANRGGKQWHPLVRLVIENPISAFNAVAIIIGGASVYWSNQARMEDIDARVARLEQAAKEDAVVTTQKDDRTTQKIEGISRELGDVRVSVGRVETLVQYLVNQTQRGRTAQ